MEKAHEGVSFCLLPSFWGRVTLSVYCHGVSCSRRAGLGSSEESISDSHLAMGSPELQTQSTTSEYLHGLQELNPGQQTCKTSFTHWAISLAPLLVLHRGLEEWLPLPWTWHLFFFYISYEDVTIYSIYSWSDVFLHLVKSNYDLFNFLCSQQPSSLVFCMWHFCLSLLHRSLIYFDECSYNKWIYLFNIS